MQGCYFLSDDFLSLGVFNHTNKSLHAKKKLIKYHKNNLKKNNNLKRNYILDTKKKESK